MDSTAILLRWIHDPASRDFGLRDLVVLTAMTGDEWPQTARMVSSLVLPLLRAHHIRYVQVARAGPVQSDGIHILDDSRSPARLLIEGDYTLGTEMLTAGTVPQCGGARKCSAKAKGWPLDQAIARIADGPYRHAMGFESAEGNRAMRDATFNTARRTGMYPLIEWGWDRQESEDYIREKLGVTFPKSACTYCPFALITADGRARTLERFGAEPLAGANALFMEHVAVALNPRQGLLAGSRLFDVLTETPGQEQVLALVEDRLDRARWAVYHVRRGVLPSSRAATRPGTSARSVRAVATGSRAAMRTALEALATAHGLDVDHSDHRHPRVWSRRRAAEGLPTAEEYYALAPHVVADKQRPGFAAAWHTATTTEPTIVLPLDLPAPLLADLDLLCESIGRARADALAEALQNWAAEAARDPALHRAALAQLDEQAAALSRRRAFLTSACATPERIAS